MASHKKDTESPRPVRRPVGSRMHGQFDELPTARDQMEQLLQLIVDVGSDLDLDAMPKRIVAAAMDLTGARYGALGVRGADGTLASFVHAGADAQAVARIGDPPTGKGLLGLLLDRTEALRLDDMKTHPAAVGLPDLHFPMRAFLGVPITIRGVVYGSLYLADDRPGRPFTESDERAVRALAWAAAVAIDNARLFDRVCTSARWMKASREISTTLLSGADPHQRSLELIAEHARRLTDAEQAIVLVPTDAELPAEDVDTLVVSAAVGMHAATVVSQQVPVEGSTSGEVFRSGTPLVTESFRHPIAAFTDVGQRSAIVMPLRAHGMVLGVIALARNQSQPPFDTGYLDLVSDFANHTTMALTLAAARAHERQMTILADRERIAHDLHDHVIQRLFAVGMDLQGTLARARSPEVIERLTRTIDEMQSTIDDIRGAIFQLKTPAAHTGDFRHRIHDVVAGLTDDRDITTTLRMSGPMTLAGGALAEHAEAVVTEAVSNAVRHSGASRLLIEITAADDLAIDIIDNGCGIPADNQRRSGLANMRRRAGKLGGTCEITLAPEGGTHVRWAAPLIDS